MSLTLVPTPLGNPQDMSLRAITTLQNVEHVIVEEFKESTRWLREHNIKGKNYHPLNEHSTTEDYQALVELCAHNEVALITDCGTPGFCDPGAQLVQLLRQRGIAVKALPGPSSLMMLLSLSGEQLNQFLFQGFPPRETGEREQFWLRARNQTTAMVVIETPYRLQKVKEEVGRHLPERRTLWALQLTQADEQVIECWGREAPQKVTATKAEFMLLIHSEGFRG